MKYIILIIVVILSLGASLAQAEVTISDQSAKALWEAFDKKEAESAASVSEAARQTALEKNTSTPIVAGIPTKSSTLPWIKTAVSFVAVVSLILFLGLGVGNKLKNLGIQKGSQASLRILQNVSVGVKKQVVVMEYEGVHLLVGVTAQGMHMLYAHPPKGNQEVAMSVPEAELAERAEAKPSFEAIQQAYSHAMETQQPDLQKPAVQAAPVSVSQKIRQTLSQMRSFRGKELPQAKTAEAQFVPQRIEEEVKSQSGQAKKVGHFFYA